ncbi:MAG: DNA repair protein RecO (recombination protein O) [Parcubacteria group bacterium Gr01-1014_107]|nr:MAG: DNA repair protein RecO (recombination protein O) [Parcubacteria group bacterium Gr01-1014_107]
MYRKYHTKGFVLESFNYGESNKLFLVLTEKLGLIRVSARSVRELKSKLRYGLINYSLSYLTVIKSKKGWKITGATPLSSAYFDLKDFKQRTSFFKILALLKKLVPEEEPNPLLFNALLESYLCLLNNELGDELCRSLECLTVLRILKNLGYLDYPANWHYVVEASGFTPLLLSEFAPFRKKAIFRINQSLKESQLM